MNSHIPQDSHADNSDLSAISSIHRHMIDSWNRGSGEGFASSFTENADFIAFEGTHLRGRKHIISFHQQLFDTSLKGTRLEGAVKFVRFLGNKLAIMHSVVRVTLAGQTAPSPGRDSMQLYFLVKFDEGWRTEALLNARVLTLERQFLLDDLDSLNSEAQSRVAELITTLKPHNQAEKGRPQPKSKEQKTS